ncbi:MAG: peptidylprolyl isomerase [Thermoanaerobaculaceae bacterium]
MKRLLIGGLFLWAGLSSAEVAFKVNGREVSTAQLQLAKRSLLARMGMQPGNVDDAALTKAAVDQLVAMQLLAEAASEAKVTVDHAEVKAAIEKEKEKMGGEEAFAQALKGAGMSEADLMKIQEQSLLIQKFIAKEITPKATVSSSEVEAYYKSHPEEFKHEEQIKLQMILTRPATNDDKAQGEAKSRAEAAAKRVASGEDFAKVAAEVSQDRSAASGGEIGWVRRGMLLPELEGPVFALKGGDVSPVLQSQFGYHVFRVAERRPAGQYPFEEVKDNLTQVLQQRKNWELVEQIVETRKAKASIEPLDPQVKAALAQVDGKAAKDGKH